MNYTKEQISSALDYAALSPLTTVDDIKRSCALANKNAIRSVCVAPIYVLFASQLFDNVSTVIGFPHGNTLPASKIHEAYCAIQSGAKEIDFVINYGRFLDGDDYILKLELESMVLIAKRYHILIKAILETCYYTPKQIWNACRICATSGVNYVKSSTGYGKHGATPETIDIMLDAVKGKAEVKASGGIHNYAQVKLYLDMGCTRIGSSYYQALLPEVP